MDVGPDWIARVLLGVLVDAERPLVTVAATIADPHADDESAQLLAEAIVDLGAEDER